MPDKQIEYLQDAKSGTSSCCGASLYNVSDGVGMCSDCKEWASDERVDEETLEVKVK